ncbi:hypothetical protein Q4555_00215 [Octadecabacter sp. 1_MG-2023]|uniref:hypothetical protein n=1 Tax=unclassified Octadecabacter TaxID=196158 RepID=UPI001C08F506|nr:MULTISPECIES: hypothetical protein [unclassified Octadecabacter]MBU2993473.1 hypothetical protein [Octadecabacter sp. B2R22]MDO6733071.1 hypothetical protein [Octadecabacter sp. 1_MG-2023]
MADISTDKYLMIDAKALLKQKLIRSYLRTALGFGSFGLAASLIYSAFEHHDAGYSLLALVTAIFSFLILIGYTPRNVFGLLLSGRDYWPTTSIHDTSIKRARVAAAHSAIRTGENLGPDVFHMRRRLKILLILRLLAAVAILMIWISLRWFDQQNKRAAHFERFGTYQGVSILVDLDGNETITVDPNASQLSVATRVEQPPRTYPERPTVQPAPTPPPDDAPDTTPPVNRTPIIPPNPPLPSYWPAITPGYSAKIYDRTASGGLELIEIRLQYADGKMYAVGP